MEKELHFNLNLSAFADLAPADALEHDESQTPSEFEVQNDRLEIDLKAPAVLGMGVLAVESVSNSSEITIKLPPQNAVALGGLALAR